MSWDVSRPVGTHYYHMGGKTTMLFGRIIAICLILLSIACKDAGLDAVPDPCPGPEDLVALNGKLVFTGFEGHITVFEDGKETVIQQSEFDISRPADLQWSPDGTMISYLPYSAFGAGDSITIIHADGSFYTTPISGRGSGGCSNPVWSADGSQIAFLHREDDQVDSSGQVIRLTLRVINIDGSGEQIIFKGSGDPRSLDWSFATREFVLVQSIPTDSTPTFEALILDESGKMLSKLETEVQGESEIKHYRWSPDGEACAGLQVQ